MIPVFMKCSQCNYIILHHLRWCDKLMNSYLYRCKKFNWSHAVLFCFFKFKDTQYKCFLLKRLTASGHHTFQPVILAPCSIIQFIIINHFNVNHLYASFIGIYICKCINLFEMFYVCPSIKHSERKRPSSSKSSD